MKITTYANKGQAEPSDLTVALAVFGMSISGGP